MFRLIRVISDWKFKSKESKLNSGVLVEASQKADTKGCWNHQWSEIKNKRPWEKNQ